MIKNKLVLCVLIFVNFLYGQSITLNSGWNLQGTSSAINIVDLNQSCIDTVWTYDNGWKAYSPNLDMQNLINTNFEISTLVSIEDSEGFWVKTNDMNCSLSLNTKDISSFKVENNKWKLFGSSQSIDILKFNDTAIKILWKYKNNDWMGYSPYLNIKTLMSNADIEEISSISEGDGFWILGASDKNISMLNSVSGIISGDSNVSGAKIILSNDSYIFDTTVNVDGIYSFPNVPLGEYSVNIQKQGYKANKAVPLIIEDDVNNATFNIEELNSNDFLYHWEEDVSRSGYQYTSYINTQPKIEFLNEQINVIDLASAQKLKHDYNIILSDDNKTWNQEYASRLLETLKSIPQVKRESRFEQSLKISKWMLTSEHIADDITIVKSDNGDTVIISKNAFVNSSPKLVLLDGLKGKFFSQRLHHALVNYVTDYGNNLEAVEKILTDRFGCTTVIPNYTILTSPTTGEDENSFQFFHPNELVTIINMFEEMPSGYHVVKGLKYLVRRKDGMNHPLYSSAPAVAWPTAHEESYIEFMDTSFTADIAHMNRLMIHEKSHFIWENLFSDTLKNDWKTIGGWYVNIDDPDGWSTTKTTEFVSGYAHLKNPNEDMAESVSYYILNPDKLKSRSLPKYEFIRDRIMHGNSYISKIRDDLTFEVLNLFPDYNYPGKIKKIDINVSGSAEEDKVVTVEIALHTQDKVFDGASHAFSRVYSEIGTFKDFYMKPVDGNSSILRGSFNISKYAKNGFWHTDQIVVTDTVGNQRFEGADDFGWKMYINNPLEDIIKPEYVNDTLELTLRNEIKDGHDLQVLNVSYEINENQDMRDLFPVYASVTNPSSSAYRLEEYGDFNNTTNRANIEFYITEYHASGIYGVPYILFTDQALNDGVQYFSDSQEHQPLITLNIDTADPDLNPPEVDLNQITVTATPANPSAPDGETIVQIIYYAKDDKSGLGKVNYRLLDPQGISHYEYHYHENFYTLYFDGIPTDWKQYEIKVVLPAGSAPGIWGLQELEVYDKANNRQSYNFVETMHFEIVN